MTVVSKRSVLKLAALTTVAAAVLVGCGKKEEPKPAAAPKAEPLKIAFAYVGPVGDGGWTFAHDNARKAIEKEFGDKVVTSFVEKVPESADAERVIRDMASQGNKLIFGTTFGYMEPMLKVAPDFKDVKFEHATGFKQADNMRTYDSRTYEGAYMAGVIAGKMTKSNTLGVVASIPIPEVIRRCRRAVPEHRLLGCAANGWQEQEVRFRLGQRHDRLLSRSPPGLGHHQLGALLHQGHPRRARRQVDRQQLCVVGRERRCDRHRVHL